MHSEKAIKLITFIKKHAILLTIIGLAMLLRFVGLRHGFPYIFHPDEPTIIRSALGVRFFSNPKHFDWPHLYIYTNYFLFMGFAFFRNLIEIAGLRQIFVSVFPLMWEEPFIFYFLTRILSATLSALTTVPVYLSAKKLFGNKAALAAALAIAILPYHVWHSHYALSDAPMTFFVAWVLYFSINIITSEEVNPLDYAFAGFFVGVAASTKYNGAMAALFVAVAFFLRQVLIEKNPSGLYKKIYLPVIGGLISILSFFGGTPFALLDWKTFSRTDGPQGAFWQFTNVGKSTFENQVLKFFDGFINMFARDWSTTFVAVFVLGLILFIYFTYRKKITTQIISGLTLIYLSALAFLFYVSGFSRNEKHYYMAVYPLVALSVGWFFHLIEKKMPKLLTIVLFVFVFAVPLRRSITNAYILYLTDKRVMAADWVFSRGGGNVPEGINLYYEAKGLDIIFEDLGRKYRSTTEILSPFIAVFDCSKEYKPVEDMDPVAEFISPIRRGPDICIYSSEGIDFPESNL